MKKRAMNVLLVVCLLASNVLSVTSSAFNSLLYDVLSRLPIENILENSPIAKQRKYKSENSQLREEKKARKKKLLKAKATSRRIVKRTTRNVVKNVASLPLEAVPYLGVVTVVTVTAMDIKDGCETIKDMNEMMLALGEDKVGDEKDICGLEVPSATALAQSTRDRFSKFWGSEPELTQDDIEGYKNEMEGVIFLEAEK